MSRSFPSALPHRLRASMLAVALTLGGAHAAPADPASPAVAQHHAIDAGPLGPALARFAAAAGIALSFDAARTEGLTSPGLHGRYDVEAGLAQLLAGSGLTAQRTAPGIYTLLLRQDVAPVSPAPATGTTLATIAVVGDWLADGSPAHVFEHPGARDVARRADFAEEGATTVREVLNRMPGVVAPENNGTGSHDLALNFGIRGLNPRLASRSTVLIDGIPLPFAPYGQPQLSFAPVSLGNLDAVDVVRGGGSVRYGPQNVGGIVNFVTRAIPKDVGAQIGVQSEISPAGHGGSPKTSANLLLGGTDERGLGAALLYSGVRGSDWREHSDTTIDDVMLKGAFQIDPAHSVTAMFQHYEGHAEMPGGLNRADYDADPFQSTRPDDSFWGRRTLASVGYAYRPDSTREFTAGGFFTTTLRSGYLDQGKNLTLSPREYWVRGAQARYAQVFGLGDTRHEIGIGYRFISETSHEQRLWSPAASGVLPDGGSPIDRDTRGHTMAHALYLDDRIDVGRWTITPGIRYELISSRQDNTLKNRRDSGDYNVPLPALNVVYRMSEAWNLYGNTEGSFGTVQYSQMGKAVASGSVKPEKARTWELGTRYDNGTVQAELGAFLINFDNQYESNQVTDSVTARGETRHQGIEAAGRYHLIGLDERLRGLNAFFNYAFVDARIREAGANQGNYVPFSPRHKGLLGMDYRIAAWQFALDGQAQSGMYADNANTREENARGNTGWIPGYMVWGLNGSYDFGPTLANLTLRFGVKNVFDRRYFTRSFDDNNRGKYVGEPRTFYLNASAAF
ncbi:TonB-dependent Fe(3+) dicitrate receptor FecA [Chitiniphilus eburneus]|uniref:TonB-dependent siderophore receptor n=1 Tax=Chitiniphilus eburneus TaxID=2571148 RepID=A0A4U0PXN5_9NEIS|nr:TonB-dependent Fe(3+) dicitrate receptor FecA [Chitiniphilus eburneus]TJZ73307.1 TonB-dependent siderophore receptor [Chitiniphilus eburneus]